MLTPNATTTAEDVIKYVNTRVSKIKHLTGGVVFIDAIPKNPVRPQGKQSLLLDWQIDAVIYLVWQNASKTTQGSCCKGRRNIKVVNSFLFVYG